MREVYPKNDMLVVKPVAFCACYKKLQERENLSVEIQHHQFNVATEKRKGKGGDHWKVT